MVSTRKKVLNLKWEIIYNSMQDPTQKLTNDNTGQVIAIVRLTCFLRNCSMNFKCHNLYFIFSLLLNPT